MAEEEPRVRLIVEKVRCPKCGDNAVSIVFGHAGKVDAQCENCDEAYQYTLSRSVEGSSIRIDLVRPPER